MLFHTFGSPEKPTIILLHGAGLSWWGYRRVAEWMAGEYHMVLPTIDGYGDDAGEPFESIERSAEKLIEYIQREHGGHVFAVGGLSLGGQIAVEVLCQQADIADYAVLESALVIPIPGTRAMVAPTVRMSYGLIRNRWFAKLQAKALSLPDELFEDYFADSLKVSRESLINTLLSNGTYALKGELSHTQAKTLILVGGKEVSLEIKSAHKLHEAIAGSELYIAPGLKHGELSLVHPEEYVGRAIAFFQK